MLSFLFWIYAGNEKLPWDKDWSCQIWNVSICVIEGDEIMPGGFGCCSPRLQNAWARIGVVRSYNSNYTRYIRLTHTIQIYESRPYGRSKMFLLACQHQHHPGHWRPQCCGWLRAQKTNFSKSNPSCSLVSINITRDIEGRNAAADCVHRKPILVTLIHSSCE